MALHQPRHQLQPPHRRHRLRRIAAMFASIPVAFRSAGVSPAVHPAPAFSLYRWRLARRPFPGPGEAARRG